MKKCFYILLFILVSTFQLFAQDGISYKVLQTSDRVFYNTNLPQVEVMVYNTGENPFGGHLTCKVETYSGEQVYQFEQHFSVASGDSARLSFSFSVPAGFYKIIVEKEEQILEQVCIGYEPEKINPYSDTLSDLKAYWRSAVRQLAETDPRYKLTKVKKGGGTLRNAYQVTMHSFGDAMIEGYYVIPKKKGIYPVVITCTDNRKEPWLPDRNDNGERIDLVIFPRDHAVHNDAYYRGAYMDVIRAIDFVTSREESDLKNIFMQGTGRSGAFVLAACALDNRAAAVSVYAPALSGKKLYNTSGPYDIKNLTEEIECPVLMGVGLENEICPPYLNFEMYNPIRSPKEYYIFINGQQPPAIWKEVTENFYKKYQK